MSEASVAVPRMKAWLVSRSGPSAGNRYLLPDGVTRVGRNPDNDIVIGGPEAAVVSLYHLEIAKERTGCRVRDLGSTNGTYLNGERISAAELRAHEVIQLGNEGPEFAFVVEEARQSELDRTMVIQKGMIPEKPASPDPRSGDSDAVLSEAVMRARRARAEGSGGQTMLLMRDALDRVLRRSNRRLRVTIYVLAGTLVVTTSYGAWRIRELKGEKTSIDRQIRDIETRLEKTEATPEEADRLIAQLTSYQQRAESLERNLLYRIGVRDPEVFLTHELRTVMAELGAEVYSVPPEFIERVNHHIQQYQGPDRPLIERVFSAGQTKVATMRRMLEQEKLPPDLAYVALVESALAERQASAAGAAGLWQFTPPTARAYGLRVDGQVDERHDLVKSTRAGCRYLRELILDFGSGSSVMLALAAYNLGPTRVKQAVMRSVQDPIKQRNFWYLYRVRALPPETREYVPKVFAAIILGRNPQRFGFQGPSS